VNTYTQPPRVLSEEKTGNDLIVTYANGTVRTLRNYYERPAWSRPGAERYAYGTADDPFWSAASTNTVTLTDDYRSGTDRVQVFTDGQTIVTPNFYPSMPSQSQNGVLNVPPVSYRSGPVSDDNRLPAAGPIGQDPAQTTLPTNISIPYSGPRSAPFVGPVAPPDLAPTSLPSLPNGGQVPASSESYAPGVPFNLYPPLATDAADPAVRTIQPFPFPAGGVFPAPEVMPLAPAGPTPPVDPLNAPSATLIRLMPLAFLAAIFLLLK